MAQWTSELNNTSDSLPTVTQWLQTVSTECCEATRLVKIIWIPNLYNNYSLDTEAYRVRIAPSHSLYQTLEDHLEQWIEQGVVLGVSVEKGKSPKVTLVTLDNEECDWDALGDRGWKFGPVRAKRKNVSTKTPK